MLFNFDLYCIFVHKSQATNPLIIRDLTMTASFHITDWTFDHTGNILSFNYCCSRFGVFTETLVLPASYDEIAIHGYKSLIDMLHAIMGVSYYKLNAAPTLMCDHDIFTSKNAQTLVKSLYQEGLGEFFIRANLPYPYPQSWQLPQLSDTHQAKSPSTITMPQSALVAFGGGKDSYVAHDLLEKSGCKDNERCSVTLSPAIEKTITSSSDQAVTFIQRRLDPKLLDANSPARENGYNGHVPVTAINSFILLVLASLQNKEAVIFANEKSADEATLMHDTGNGETVPINHQYSKSAICEDAINAFLDDLGRDAKTDYPCYFSILRTLDERRIGYLFAQQTDHHDYFLSCNKNFTHNDKDQNHQPWCGSCPKCAFTALILSPYLNTPKTIKIFGDDFINRPSLHAFYTDILGLSDQKPWECVGTIAESRASLLALNDQKRLDKTIWSEALIKQIKEKSIALEHKKNDTKLMKNSRLPVQIITTIEQSLSQYT